MKFLFDQSADFRLIPHLTSLGTTYSNLAQLSSVFRMIMFLKFCIERRILVVADRDFGELIFQQELAHSGIISSVFREPAFEPRSNTSIPCSGEHTDDLELGEFLSVTRGQMRCGSSTG